jgi:hypothetical protein
VQEGPAPSAPTSPSCHHLETYANKASAHKYPNSFLQNTKEHPHLLAS